MKFFIRETARSPADGEEAESELTKPAAQASEKSTSSESSIKKGEPMKITQKQHETSTLYITPGRGSSLLGSADDTQSYSDQQPQIQKRVVTHVTIFPSPPLEKEDDKEKGFQGQIASQSSKVLKQDSVDDDSSKKDYSTGGNQSTTSSGTGKTSGQFKL